MLKGLAQAGVLIALILQGGDRELTPAQKNYWAWQRPVRPAVPVTENRAWPRNAIDHFILARLDKAGLKPAAAASREQMIRRVTFDLIGLPPTPQEVAAFVDDSSPLAWERVIDRLLASPHYGERWGRHWLDLVRFAESNGFEHDELRPDAWRYRDYVIQAFNADKPFDRFLLEQIAGDELFPDDPQALIATGFAVLGPDMIDAASQAQRRQNTLDDMTDTTALVFMGMTVGCARCHDHKFEPIAQRDYFRLQAFFASSKFRTDLSVASPSQKAAHAQATAAYTKATAHLTEAINNLEGPIIARLREGHLAKLSDIARQAHLTPEAERTGAQREIVLDTAKFVVVTGKQLKEAMTAEQSAELAKLRRELKTFDAMKAGSLPVAMGLADAGAKTDKTFVLIRGELGHPGEEVVPGFPRILSPGLEGRPAVITSRNGSSGRRAALAQWLAGPENPLTARVIVNRLWQHHFGNGLVATPSDFGMRGALPTHPELLDWLATELVARGWSLKQMHKLMLMSATYQQSTTASAAALAADPANELLSHMNRLRLEGEVVRDSLLFLGGRLNLRPGGPGIFPPLPPEMKSVPGWGTSPDPADHVRRSVYICARRNLRFPFLEAFDAPDSNQSCPKREHSTTAPQALALLNAADVTRAAEALALRLRERAGSTDEQIDLAYALVLSRPPTTAERALCRRFLNQSPLGELCRALLNVNEFVYLD
jgi:hypothetical protein